MLWKTQLINIKCDLKPYSGQLLFECLPIFMLQGIFSLLFDENLSFCNKLYLYSYAYVFCVKSLIKHTSQMWWHVSIIPELLGRVRQKDCQKSEASLGYIVSMKYILRPSLQNTNKKNINNQGGLQFLMVLGSHQIGSRLPVALPT